MLDMSEIEVIRDLARKGYSRSEIKQKTGYSYPTIKKYLEGNMDFSPKVPERERRGSKLDPFTADIDMALERDKGEWYKQRHTAKRIYAKLVEKGFDGSYQLVQRYVRSKRAVKVDDQYVELVWAPGQAQADFGEADFYEAGGRQRRFYLVLSFPYSNMSFTQVFKGVTGECVCQGLMDIFASTSRVPTSIVFDNATGVGRKVCGVVRETELFRRFRLHFGFSAEFTNPNAGNEKGHVEGKVGYTRRNMFVPPVHYNDMVSYNERLLVDCEALGHSETHYIKERPWMELFEEDRAAMRALPRNAFIAVTYETRVCDKYGKATLDGNHRYSAGSEHGGYSVLLGLRAHDVTVYDAEGARIISYPREYGGKATCSDNVLSDLRLLGRKPGAFRNSHVRDMLTQSVKNHLDSLGKTELRTQVETMAELTGSVGFDTVSKAMDETLRRTDRLSTSDLRIVCLRMSGYGIDTPPESGPSLADYDNLLMFKGGALGEKNTG